MFAIVNQLRRSVFNPFISPSLSGLSVVQIETLAFLFHQEGKHVFQRDVESVFKLRRSTVSSLLKNLEKAGYILRLSVPHDARLKQLLLTSKGKETCIEINQFRIKIEAQMIQNITEEELTFLCSILQKIQSNLSYVPH